MKSFVYLLLSKKDGRTYLGSRNTKENYQGLLRVDIRRSTNLNRKIKGWAQGIFENFNI